MSPNTILLTEMSTYESLPHTVVTAPNLLSFRRQLAKLDLSTFCVNFLIITIVLIVLSMHFIGVSGLPVLSLSINGNGTRRALGTAHLPPTKVLRRLSE